MNKLDKVLVGGIVILLFALVYIVYLIYKSIQSSNITTTTTTERPVGGTSPGTTTTTTTQEPTTTTQKPPEIVEEGASYKIISPDNKYRLVYSGVDEKDTKRNYRALAITSAFNQAVFGDTYRFVKVNGGYLIQETKQNQYLTMTEYKDQMNYARFNFLPEKDKASVVSVTKDDNGNFVMTTTSTFGHLGLRDSNTGISVYLLTIVAGSNAIEKYKWKLDKI